AGVLLDGIGRPGTKPGPICHLRQCPGTTTGRADRWTSPSNCLRSLRMRFRRREWDVAMSDALVAYWTAWNEPDLERIGDHLAVAVTKDVEWNDPRDSFVGITELEAAVRRLRSSKPDYQFVIASEIDHQHSRLRY